MRRDHSRRMPSRNLTSRDGPCARFCRGITVAMAGLVRCIGCRALVAETAGPVHRYMTCAPACWAMYGELNALLMTDQAAGAFRQWCVDAYAVQHPGEPGEQTIQSVAGHLVSLYATLVLRLPIDSAHDLIRRVTARKGQYRWLTPPSFEGARTIVDVMRDRDRLARAARLWARDAWQAWQSHHDQIRAWHKEVYDQPTKARRR
jgi:hypothetical protein